MRICPICLYDRSQLLHIQKFAKHFEHRIVVCLSCGFIYLNNTPPQKFYDEYYRDHSKYEGVRQHDMHYAYTYKKLESFLQHNIKDKKARILDVGCSTGDLLSLIKSKGYKNILGIDPAPICKNIAKKKYGVTVTTNTLENFNTSKKFDLIIFSQVLEHIVDLRENVMKAYSLLNENGYIFIGVPDADHFYKVGDEPFGEFSTEHINFFTKSSLKRLLARFKQVKYTSDNAISISLWQKDNIGIHNFKHYIENSTKKLKNLEQAIHKLPSKVIVWGAGVLTQRLLISTTLKKKTVRLVDSESRMWGKTLDGIQIISPDEIAQFDHPILIASYRFKDEIKEIIKKKHTKHKIITL